MTTARRPTATVSGDVRRVHRWRLTLVAVAALALAACDSDETEPIADEPAATTTRAKTTPATGAPTTVTTTTTPPTVAAVPAEEAVERAERYLAAFAGGDVDAVLGMHADEFVLRSAFGTDGLGEQSLTEWMGVVYQTALGTDYVDLECEVGDGDATATAPSTVVDCDAGMATTIHDETNSPEVPTRLTVAVSADGIARLDSRYLENLGVLGFYEWRDLQPDAPTNEPVTVEEVAEFGRLEAGFAAEYPAFGIAAADETFGAFNAADLDGFLAHFDDNTTILGVRWTDAPDVYGALMAAGQRYELSGCEPAGISGLGLWIDCDVTVLPALGSSGVEASGTVSVRVGIDGTVERISDTIDVDEVMGFRTAFEEWLNASHPDVHDQVDWLLEVIPSADDHDLIAPYYEEFIEQSDAYRADS